MRPTSVAGPGPNVPFTGHQRRRAACRLVICNHSFVPIPRFRSDATAAEVTAAIKDHGTAVIESLAGADLCDRVDAEIQPWIERTPTGVDDFAGRSTRRTGALLARSPARSI